MTGQIPIEPPKRRSNAYRAYIPFMSDAYLPLPSSIIAEGLDIWEGAGDRGDAAMYLYGASLFCLYAGDEALARELFGAIRWCAEYWRKAENARGRDPLGFGRAGGAVPDRRLCESIYLLPLLRRSALCRQARRVAGR